VAPQPAAPPAEGVGEVATGWGWPLDGPVSSRFGARAHDSWHTGVDITAPRGSAVLAAKDGEVTFAGRQGRYGQLVILNHGAGATSWYAHLDRILVVAGRRVRRGEKIGTVGVTGNATGAHLHFEIRREGRPVDPLPFLP
jgi:murein DD-endopeptidase MepM/ murein hydrolase activator NlpD